MTIDEGSLARTKTEWEARFGVKDAYFFGQEPSDMARWVWHFWEATGRSPGRLIDLGAGEGRDTVYFARKGFQVTAVELSQAGVEKISALAGARDVKLERLIHGSVLDVDLNGFDVIYSNNCIQCLGEGCLNFLSSMKAMLTPGGLLAVSLFSNVNNALCSDPDFYCCVPGELASQFDGWKLLWQNETSLWRVHSNAYRSFTALIAEKPA